MDNLVRNLKNLILNRNAVTILGVLAGVIALWFVYNTTLTKAISPTRVPVATRTITAGSLITTDDFEFVEVSNDFLKKASVITSSAQLLEHYVNNGTAISKGSMFYTNQVVTKDELIDRDIQMIPEGYHLFWLKVDNTSTYANSIYPGDKIDLWLKVKGSVTNNLTVYEEFITSIDVLSVKDSSGLNVFDVSGGERTPNWLVFAVDTEMFELLTEIKELSGMQLYPVPKNKLYTTEGSPTEYSNDRLKALVESQVANFSEE